MGQLVVVVEAVVLVAESERAMPLHAGLAPMVEPAQLVARTDEELHLHLLELAHAEDELPRDDLIAERLADLRDAERNLHPAGLLYVQEVDENALSRFGAQVDRVGSFADRADLRLEHQVELAHFGPVARARDRADDAAVDDDLPQLVEVVVVEGLHHPLVRLVALGLMLGHAGLVARNLASSNESPNFLRAFSTSLAIFSSCLAMKSSINTSAR